MCKIAICPMLVRYWVRLMVWYSLQVGVRRYIWNYFLIILVTAAWKVLDLNVLDVSSKDLICCKHLIASSDWGSGWHHHLTAACGSRGLANQIFDSWQKLQHLLFVTYFNPVAFQNRIERWQWADVSSYTFYKFLFALLGCLIPSLEFSQNFLIFFF